MKALSQDDKVVTKNTVTQRTPFKVCMHVRGVLRTDGRVTRAAVALVEAGFTVTALDIEDDLTRPVEEDIGGIHVKHIMKPGWLIPVRLGPWRLIRSTQKFICTTLQLIRMPADVYHAHDVTALPASYIAAWVHRKPLVFDAHELPLKELDGTSRRWRWLHALLTRLLAFMLHRCAGIITVSPPIAQEICRCYHVPRVTLIRNLPKYKSVPKSNLLQQYLDLNPNVRIALYQGNIQPIRGLDVLIHAAAFLERDIVIVMMGKEVGMVPSQFESLIKREGVSDRVKIIPPVPYAELLSWTASADIGLVVYSSGQTPAFTPNIQMSLPNKLFEYLMAGLPVLASSLDAVADIIQTYDVGCIVPSHDPVKIGGAINAMLADRDTLKRMHNNALDATSSDLCWEKESQQLVGLYRSILSGQVRDTSDIHTALTT